MWPRKRAEFVKTLEDAMGGVTPPLHKVVVIIGDRVRFTATGRRHFTRHFARAGISIQDVKTIEHFREACEMSFSQMLEAAAAWLRRNRPPTDEYRLLIAIVEGNAGEKERLERKLARRARLQLVHSQRRTSIEK